MKKREKCGQVSLKIFPSRETNTFKNKLFTIYNGKKEKYP